MKKLNLGCGKDIKSGYVNLDSVKLPGVDVVHNLEKYPWPFKDNTFDFIYCDNVLEHLESTIKPMEQIWRISKKKGKVVIKVPAFPGPWSITDPTHKRFFTLLTFNYFTTKDRLNYYTKARFRIIKRKLLFHKWLMPLTWLFNLSENIQKFHAIFLANLIPANTLHFELETIK